MPYAVKETVSNLWRNRLMTLAAILTVAVSLSLVGAALLLNQGVSRAVGKWRGGVELIVYMTPAGQPAPAATPAQIQAVRQQLSRDPEVKSFHYVGPAQSYQEAKQYFSSQPDLLKVLKPDDLPTSFRVVLRHADQAGALGRRFGHQPGVYRVLYNRQAVDAMLRVTDVMQIVIVALAVILALSALVLILNAIRVAIFARRREVAVMKLVGATNWFIRVPFMLEGLVQGLVGALVAAGAVFGMGHLVSYLIAHYQAHLFSYALVTGHQVLLTAVAVIVLGAVIGTGASVLGVRRFLEV
jgi:cell division transport system permease protein